MRRVAVVAALTLSAWLGLAVRAEAQCLVTPVGPLAVHLSPASHLGLDSPPPLVNQAADSSSTTPVAREVEGHHLALPSCDYFRRRGVRHAK